MSELDKLKPARLETVYGLVQQAGLDVSDWANFAKGKDQAASNPKYCYEWSFVASGRLVILCLWHAEMRETDGVVFIQLNLRQKALNEQGVRKKRALEQDRAIQEAAKSLLPIRVVINDGAMPRVENRCLDQIPWSIAFYQWESGDCILIRGAEDGKFVDQFSVRQEPEIPAERRTVSRIAFVRDVVIRHQARLRARGKCEYCGVKGFEMSDGSIFLETHHVIFLSEGGSDSLENVAALCANHHREAHHGAQKEKIRLMLLNRLRSAGKMNSA